jgi:hypothetical protein
MSNRPTGMGNINKTPYNPTGAPPKEGEEPKIVATLLTNPPQYKWSDGSVTDNPFKPGSFEEDEAINRAKNLEERKKAFQQRKGGNAEIVGNINKGPYSITGTDAQIRQAFKDAEMAKNKGITLPPYARRPSN